MNLILGTSNALAVCTKKESEKNNFAFKRIKKPKSQNAYILYYTHKFMI